MHCITLLDMFKEQQGKASFYVDLLNQSYKLILTHIGVHVQTMENLLLYIL